MNAILHFNFATMAEIHKTVLVKKSAEKMFGLVDSCENYPQFLPWCADAKVLKRTDEITAARLFIRYKMVKTDFATENQKKFPESMVIHLIDGPFKKLEGAWQFLALKENACKIDFRLSYEFSNRLMEKVIGSVFHHITNTFVDAFVKEARKNG